MRKIISIACPVLFVAVGLWLLLGESASFLTETALLTPFYTTRVFTTDMFLQVGGGVFGLSSLLQSCLALPWLGSGLLLGVLVALAYAVRWSFRLGNDWEGLAWLPSWALLLNYTQVGYMIYLVKVPAVAFTLPVGVLAAVLLAGCWYRSCAWWQRVAWLLLVPTLGYYLLGCFAVLAGMLAAVGGLATMWHQRRSDVASWLTHGAVFVLSWGVPQVFYAMGLVRMRANQLYTMGLPDYHWNDAERALFYPALAAALLLLVMALMRCRNARRAAASQSWLKPVVAFLLFVAGGVGTWHNTYRDANFTAILQMKHAAEQGEWEQVLSVARTTPGEPTRAQVCLTRLALYKLGRLGDELFKYPDGAAPYNAPRPHQYLELTVGRLLYFYYGKINFSYRWCMEDMVEYGLRPDYLRLMYRIAELNHEEALAAKYAAALGHTLFYRSEVEAGAKGGAFAPHELLNYADVLDGDAGLIEFYLLNSFALTDGGSKPMVELSMMHNLITKNLHAFWPRFFKLLPTWKGHIPCHYQEAALMIAQLQGHPELLQNVPIDADIRARFERLVQASAQNADPSYNRTILRPEFGDTYWYYYFFVEGLKTT